MILIWSRVCYLALSSWSEGILFVFPRIQPCTSYIPGTQYIICWINECVVAGTLFDSVTTHVGCADVSWHRIFLDLAQQGHLKAWRYSMKKKKKTGEGAYLDAEGWERGIRVWLEKTLYSYGGNCLWESPQDWRNLTSSWKAPCERGGQVGTSQLRFLLLYCLSPLPCPKPGDPRNLIGSREDWPLTIDHPYHH